LQNFDKDLNGGEILEKKFENFLNGEIFAAVFSRDIFTIIG